MPLAIYNPHNKSGKLGVLEKLARRFRSTVQNNSWSRAEAE
jgi:hypothetical protein